MAKQATEQFAIQDNMPSVEKLWNGRFRLEFTCSPANKNEGWYSGNIDKWFPAFGTLSDVDFSGDNWAPAEVAVTYPDMRLVEVSAPYFPSGGSHYVVLAYETLTSAFVQEKDDDTDYELNGLRRVTRPLVAMAGADYQKTVGTDTIAHQIDTETAVTLYLAGYEIDDTDAYRRVVEVWMEAGTLSVHPKGVSEGVIEVSTSFFGVEGATVGPVIDRFIGDFEGLQTINVVTLQDVDGNSVVDGGENLVNQVSGVSPFTYPGVMDVNYEVVSTGIFNIQTLLKKAPAQSRIKTTTYFIFQTANALVASDFTYLLATGLWSPNHWAGIAATATGIASHVEWNDSATFRGYRTSGTSDSGQFTGSPQAAFRWQGVTQVQDASGIIYDSVVDQGPPDPIGNIYTLDVQINPAFDDVDGNKYYKKTIVVTDAIPTQPLTASLPYT